MKITIGTVKVPTKTTSTNTPTAPKEPVQTPKPPAQQQQPQQPAFDQAAYLKQMQDQVNNIYEQQKQAQLAQLYASRDKAVGQLNQQKAELAPQYQSQRNQADVTNAQNVQKLRELMANSGLTSSGENVSATVGLQNARQNALNSLNLQEQQANNDINRQISDLNNPANEQALTAALEAQKSQALYDAWNKSSDRAYQVGRDTVADNQWQQSFDTSKNQWQQQFDYGKTQDSIQNAMNEANLTGKYNGKNTLAYTQMVADLTGKYNGKDTFAAQQANAQMAWQKSQFKSQQEWQKYVFNHMSASDKAQLEWAKKQFGESQAYEYFALKSNLESQKAMNNAQINAYNNSGFSNAQGGSGGFTRKASGTPTKSFQSDMSAAVKMGVPQSWVAALTELVGRESSWNPTIKNPKSTAHGYAQFLDKTEAAYTKKMGLNYGNPVHQLVMMAQYVKDRYGTPEKALAFWDKNHYY